jgi:FSR family fosmidomycin resistance protein-like MFS transporter
VDAFDEATAGLPSAGAFALQSSFGTSVATLNAAIFVAPLLFALLVEGPILVWCECFPRHRLLGAGLFAMAVGSVGCAIGSDVYWFSAALSVCAVASGLACGVAQAALVDSDPERREQRMTQWATAGWLGDLGAPILLWSSAAMGFGWRSAYVAMGIALALGAAVFARHPLPVGEAATETETEPSLRHALRVLLRSRGLFLWLFGVALCSLLDEIVAVLLGLRIDAAGGDTASVSQALLAFTLGGVVGLLALDRLLQRVAADRLLVLSCVACALVTGALLVSDSLAWVVALAFLVGMFSAAHYPLAQARAYAALPGRSLLVAAAAQPFLLFDLAFPLGTGWIADRFGPGAALALTLFQPIGLLLVVALLTRSSRRGVNAGPRRR